MADAFPIPGKFVICVSSAGAIRRRDEHFPPPRSGAGMRESIRTRSLISADETDDGQTAKEIRESRRRGLATRSSE